MVPDRNRVSRQTGNFENYFPGSSWNTTNTTGVSLRGVCGSWQYQIKSEHLGNIVEVRTRSHCQWVETVSVGLLYRKSGHKQSLMIWDLREYNMSIRVKPLFHTGNRRPLKKQTLLYSHTTGLITRNASTVLKVFLLYMPLRELTTGWRWNISTDLILNLKLHVCIFLS